MDVTDNTLKTITSANQLKIALNVFILLILAASVYLIVKK
jgi:hypothetical protein